jgi:hypothetical protein
MSWWPPETFKVMTSILQLQTIDSVASLLAITLYKWNIDRKNKLWNIVSTERYSGIHLMKVLLHIDELFTMGKLKPPLSSDRFAINRPSLSISRYMSRYKSDLALSAVFFIKFRGTNAIKLVTKLWIMQWNDIIYTVKREIKGPMWLLSVLLQKLLHASRLLHVNKGTFYVVKYFHQIKQICC